MWNILRKGILDKDYLAKPSLSYVIFPILSRVVFWKSAYAFVYILTSVVNINTSLQFTILSLLYKTYAKHDQSYFSCSIVFIGPY